MQEIRTSDNLEKEILEDARKKAERIIKNAEKQAAEARLEWNRRIEAELSGIELDYGIRKSRHEMEVKASIPLELNRKRLYFLDDRFEKLLSFTTKRLSDGDVEEILAGRGGRAGTFLKDGDLEIHYAGISPETAREIAEKLTGERVHDLRESKGYRGIIFKNAAKGFSFRLTMEEVMEYLREYRRRQVLDILFKGKY